MLTCLYEQLAMERTLFAHRKDLKVAGELRLPEEYPELEQVLSYHGYLADVKGEIVENKLSLSGMLETHLVYRSKEDLDRTPVHGLIWKGPEGVHFNAEIELPELTAEWDWHARLVKLSLQPETGHTLTYQLELEVMLRAREINRLEFVKGIESETKVEVLAEQFISEEPVWSAKVNREVVNHFSLSYPKPPAARILSCQVVPVGTTATLAKEQVNIEGKLEVYLMYLVLTEDGLEGGVEVQKWTEENGGAVPFQIIIDAPQAAKDLSLNYELWLEGAQMYSTLPENCRLQATIGAKVELFKMRQINALVDLSPEQGLLIDINRKTGELVEVIEETERVFAVEKTLTLPGESKNLRRILSATVANPKVDWALEQDQLILTGETQFTLVYLAEDDEEPTWIEAVSWGDGGDEPLTFGDYLELPGVDEGMNARVYLNTNRLKVEQVDERTIKLLLEYNAQVKVTQVKTLALVTDSALVLPPEGPQPSMTFYFVQPGDNLWMIARRYNTTMAALAKTNQLTDYDSELPVGKKLLIPKTPVV
ncbi:MAG: LysM peptidoglycan-binding domain-containing protein [Firmicutes bacterium]|nr:LysM peptidoglycan-binding domain-containing protein [Bacillota bacterium]